MKKLILFFGIFFSIVSCSSNDDNDEVTSSNNPINSTISDFEGEYVYWGEFDKKSYWQYIYKADITNNADNPIIGHVEIVYNYLPPSQHGKLISVPPHETLSVKDTLSYKFLADERANPKEVKFIKE